MKYMLLICGNEAETSRRTPAEHAAVIKEFGQFTEAIQRNGQFVSGERLQPVATATTVRIRDGKTLTTDGPFAETKEQLGGYYVIDVKDLDEALAIAARIPAARWGSIEVRPIHAM
jgi:hypothetical protein